MTAAELRRAYETGERSPVEVAREHLERLERMEPELNAFVTVTPELALEGAAAAERAYADGTAGPLAGIPATIKDLVQLAGVRCTMGSAVHARPGVLGGRPAGRADPGCGRRHPGQDHDARVRLEGRDDQPGDRLDRATRGGAG